MRESGLILVDKPAGWTSFDVVNKLRAILQHDYNDKFGEKKKIKVGHSGTLDPFATGLLVVAYGKCTKRLESLLKKDKVYEAEMILGASSTTGDPEGEIVEADLPKITVEMIIEALARFEGKIMQAPPSYSAIKIGGEAAYKKARRGEEVKIEPRQVTVNALKFVSNDENQIKFTADVGSGTYIRVLAEDVAKQLGTKGYLTQLRRVSIDSYQIDKAVKMDEITTEDIYINSLDC